jgi:CRISPR-associated endoribonuclease Cas6
MIFRRIACVPQCPGARECEGRALCPYARMFEPSALENGPSGLVDWPRPFVFRATHLDGSTVRPGAAFSFDLNLFDMRSPAIAYLVMAFSQLAREGLGPSRGRADLSEVWQVGEGGESVARIFDGQSFLLQDGPAAMELSLAPEAEPVERIRVQFKTPTELKSGQQVAVRPEFGVLASRIRDRLSTLRKCYDDGPLAIDFREFGERAAGVRMTRCEIRQVAVERRSSRTGQVHPIGGFVGEAEYEGDLAEFVPYLKAAKWVGVGRQTVWGKGEIAHFLIS